MFSENDDMIVGSHMEKADDCDNSCSDINFKFQSSGDAFEKDSAFSISDEMNKLNIGDSEVYAVGIALSFILYNTSFILVSLHQDHEIAHGAGKFNRWMIPAIFAYAILQRLIRFLQTQHIVVPMMIIYGATATFHVFLCWLFVFKIVLGSKWAALANSTSYWINAVLLALYVKFSSDCSRTFTGLSREAFNDIPKFLRLAVPSGIMICLEFWLFHAVVLLSDLLPDPKLETSTLSISNETKVVQYLAKIMLLLALSDFLDGFQSVLSGASMFYVMAESYCFFYSFSFLLLLKL
ncbi:hypothetical protein ACS0TY_005714 [Phlomoides rotata]